MFIFIPTFSKQVPVKSWFDDLSDSELLDLIPLFEKLSQVDSVYTVLCNSNNPINQSIYNNLNNITNASSNQHIQSSGQQQHSLSSSSNNSSGATSCNNLNNTQTNDLVNNT